MPLQAQLLERIGLSQPPSPDAAGLRVIVRAFITAVPYENLAVQLGEYAPLDARRLIARVLHGGRGGYCFDLGTVLHALLESLGFAVERRQGIVGERDARRDGQPTNHMALVVSTPEGPFLADAGLGQGPVDALALRPGTVQSGAFTYRVEREGDGWWVTHHPYASFTGVWFADAPSPLEDFQPHHRRLATSPESSFVQTLVVQQPASDRILTLRARTLFLDGPGLRERRVIENERAFAAVLAKRFGIDPGALGSDRVSRLWRAAERQHAEHPAAAAAE